MDTSHSSHSVNSHSLRIRDYSMDRSMDSLDFLAKPKHPPPLRPSSRMSTPSLSRPESRSRLSPPKKHKDKRKVALGFDDQGGILSLRRPKTSDSLLPSVPIPLARRPQSVQSSTSTMSGFGYMARTGTLPEFLGARDDMPGRLMDAFELGKHVGLDGAPILPMSAPSELPDQEEMQEIYNQFLNSMPPSNDYNLVFRWAEVTMVQILNITQNMPIPNPLRTALICAMFDRLIHLFPRYKALLKDLRRNIYGGMYTNFEERSASKSGEESPLDVSPPASPKSPKIPQMVFPKTNSPKGSRVNTPDLKALGLTSRSLPSANTSVMSMNSTISSKFMDDMGMLNYIDMKLFAEVYRERKANLLVFEEETIRREETCKRRILTMQGGLNEWRRVATSIYFKAWRKFIAVRKRSGAWIAILRAAHWRHTRKIIFNKWRWWVNTFQLSRRQERHQNNLQKARDESSLEISVLVRRKNDLLDRRDEVKQQLMALDDSGPYDPDAVFDLDALRNHASELQTKLRDLQDRLYVSSDALEEANQKVQVSCDHLDFIMKLSASILASIPGETNPKVGKRPPCGSAIDLVHLAMAMQADPNNWFIRKDHFDKLDKTELTPMDLSKTSPEWLLLAFVNLMCRHTKHPRSVNNFTSDLVDGETFAAVMQACFPATAGKLDAQHPLQRCEKVVAVAKAMGMGNIVSAQDIIESEVVANMRFIAWIMRTFVHANTGPHIPESDMEELRQNFVKLTEQNMKQRTGKLRVYFSQAVTARSSWELLLKTIDNAILQALLMKSKGEEKEYVDVRFSRDLVNFSQVRGHNIVDITEDMGKDVIEREIQSTQKILAQSAVLLRKIYQYYGAFLDPNPALCFDEFFKFCEDTKLIGKHVSPEQLQFIFKRTLIGPEYTEDDDIEEDGDSAYSSPKLGAVVSQMAAWKSMEMRPADFSEALIRLAELRYRGNNHLPTIGQRVAKLIQEHLTKALFGDIDEFKKLAYSSKVQLTLAQYSRTLARLFHYYAEAIKEGNTEYTIDLKEFTQIWKDLDMLDKRMDKLELSIIFTFTQDAEDISGNDDMCLREFLEAIVAVALFRVPSPILPLHVRLDIFINRQLLPDIKRKLPRIKL